MTLRPRALIVSAALLATPAAADLHLTLSNYVDSVKFEQLTSRHEAALETVLNRQDLSHGERVLAVHSILSKAGALGHVDVHEGSLTPATDHPLDVISTSNEIVWNQ